MDRAARNLVASPEIGEGTFRAILDNHFPWPENSPPNYAELGRLYFGEGGESNPAYYDTVHNQVLKPLSQWGLAEATRLDLFSYLPSLSDPLFPSLSLALVLLLDQCPREFYSGHNKRYIHGYFHFMAKTFFRRLVTLPAELRPDSRDRWMALRYSMDEWMVRRFWFYGPLIHSENLEDQLLMQTLVQPMRIDVETLSGLRDPGRDGREQDSGDTLLFYTLIKLGPPEIGRSGGRVQIQDFVFWICRVFEAHTPIVTSLRKFPYQNGYVGAGFSSLEIEFLKQTEY